MFTIEEFREIVEKAPNAFISVDLESACSARARSEFCKDILAVAQDIRRYGAVDELDELVREVGQFTARREDDIAKATAAAKKIIERRGGSSVGFTVDQLFDLDEFNGPRRSPGVRNGLELLVKEARGLWDEEADRLEARHVELYNMPSDILPQDERDRVRSRMREAAGLLRAVFDIVKHPSINP